MGRVVGYFKKTAAEFERAKGIVTLIPSSYQDNFNTKYADVVKMRDKAINENKTIYFEKELGFDQITPPAAQNFVKLEPMMESLHLKLPIEDKLRHIVPPQVRTMQVELKQKLQEVINGQFEHEQKEEA
jgi:hypothetical protein